MNEITMPDFQLPPLTAAQEALLATGRPKDIAIFNKYREKQVLEMQTIWLSEHQAQKP